MFKRLACAVFVMFGGVVSVFADGGGEELGGGGGDELTHKMATLAIQIGLILFAAKIGGMVAEKLKMPGVLGELCAGIAIGPYALGAVPLWGFFPAGVFPAASATFPVTPELYGICSVASVILLFLAGVETDLKMFMRYSLAGSLVGIGGVVVSFFGGALCAVLFLHRILPESYPAQLGFMDAPTLFLGIMCTATSVGITARILSERKVIDSEEGVTTMAGAVLDDVLGIVVLAVGLGVIGAKGSPDAAKAIDWSKIAMIAAKAFGVWLGATLIGIVAARKISTLLKLFHSPVTIGVMALGLALILAGFFEKMGLAMIIGAYVMGLALSRTDIRYVVHENLSSVYSFMVPVFFCVMGMMVDCSKLASAHVLMFGAIYTAVAILAKIAGCAIPASFCGFNLLGSLRIGAGMIPRGEVALIIAGIGLSGKYLTSEVFGIGILMTLVTTVVAPPILIKLFAIKKSGLRNPTDEKNSRPFSFALASPAAADMMQRKLIEAFRNDGFFTHLLSHDDDIWQVRRDNMEIGMRRIDNELHFECNPHEESFIATAILEVTAELTNLANELNKPIKTRKIARLVNTGATPGVSADNELSRYIRNFLIIPHMRASGKDELIEKMMRRMYERGLVRNFDEGLKAVMERENTMSTGLENGIAIPHARTNTVTTLVGAVAIVHDGVENYPTIDDSRVRIVIMTLSPMQGQTPHLRLISHLSQILNESGREKILAAQTEAEILHVLL